MRPLLAKALAGSLVASAFFVATNVHAETLYGVTGTNSSTSTLFKIDPNTGAPLARIGTLAIKDGGLGDGGAGGVGFVVTGMARHPVTGIMYATTCANPNSPAPFPLADGGDPRSYLIKIDLNTGVGTPIGQLSANRSDPIAGITFDKNGTLYGWFEGNDSLVTVDLNTGALSEVVDVGMNTYGSGIAFDNEGNLFYTGRGDTTNIAPNFPPRGSLVVLDKEAGAPKATMLMVDGGSGKQHPIGALAVSHAGVLFGVRINYNVTPRQSDLIRIEPAPEADAGVVSVDAGPDAADGGDAGTFPAAWHIVHVGDTNITDVNFSGADAGNAVALAAIAFNLDYDDDGVLDGADNCPNVANPTQADCNGNGIGDACDPNVCDAGSDASSGDDSGSIGDDASSGGLDSGSGTGGDAGSGNGDTGSSSGCGCGIVGADAASGSSVLAVLALAGLRLRRRRRA